MNERGLEPHYTTAELAEAFSVHPETIRRHTASGRLRSRRIGRDRRGLLGVIVSRLALRGARRGVA